MALRISVLQGYPSGQEKPPVDIGLKCSVNLPVVGGYSSSPPAAGTVQKSQQEVCPELMDNPISVCGVVIASEQ